MEKPDWSAGDLLEEAAELFHKRNAEYGPSYFCHGVVMDGLFPNGVRLVGADEFNRFALFDLMVVKLVRYAQNFDKGGHRDSLRDLAVYTKMLEEVDARISDGCVPWVGQCHRRKAED